MLVFSVDAICHITYTPSYVDNATIKTGAPLTLQKK